MLTMPRADFCLLPVSDFRAALPLVCRWLAESFQHRQSIYVLVSTPTHAQQLDDALWTFSDTQFIPHGQRPPDPITIQSTFVATPHTLILNITDTLLLSVTETQSIVEVVFQEAGLKQKAREKYRLYRDNHFSLETHTGLPLSFHVL